MNELSVEIREAEEFLYNNGWAYQNEGELAGRWLRHGDFNTMLGALSIESYPHYGRLITCMKSNGLLM